LPSASARRGLPRKTKFQHKLRRQLQVRSRLIAGGNRIRTIGPAWMGEASETASYHLRLLSPLRSVKAGHFVAGSASGQCPRSGRGGSPETPLVLF
jgi:hypothetical protein